MEHCVLIYNFFFFFFLWHLVLSKSFGRHHNIPPFFTVLNYYPSFLYSPIFQGLLPQHPATFSLVSLEVSFPLVSNSALFYLMLSSLLRVACPNHWILCPLMKLITDAIPNLSCSSS